MRKVISYIIFLFVCLSGLTQQKGYAQESIPDSLLNDKISMGFSFGPLFYKGDVKSNSMHQSLSNKLGFQLFLFEHRLNANSSMGFSVMAGKLFGDETSATRFLNFKTSVTLPKLYYTYNFSQMIWGSQAPIEPYASIGLGFLFFKATGDLKDATGNVYYNWTDGKLYNKPQSSPDAASAVMLQRDYSYESDLRDLDIDGIGKYRQYALAIPLELGVKKSFNKQWSAKLGFQYTYLLSDNIDNVSSASMGIRKGNKSNDLMMAVSAGVSYKFHFRKLTAADIEEEAKQKTQPIKTDATPAISGALPTKFEKFDLNKNGKIEKIEIDKAIDAFFDNKISDYKEIEELIKYFHSSEGNK